MKILGISAFYHDSASALVEDGIVVAAAQEERFTRVKHDPGFPANAIDYCLTEAGLKLRDLDAIAFYEKPFLTFERLMETYQPVDEVGIRLGRIWTLVHWSDSLSSWPLGDRRWRWGGRLTGKAT